MREDKTRTVISIVNHQRRHFLIGEIRAGLIRQDDRESGLFTSLAQKQSVSYYNVRIRGSRGAFRFLSWPCQQNTPSSPPVQIHNGQYAGIFPAPPLDKLSMRDDERSYLALRALLSTNRHAASLRGRTFPYSSVITLIPRITIRSPRGNVSGGADIHSSERK